MAEIKFGAYSVAYYGDVERADRPKSKGLTLVPTNRYSGKPVVDTDVAYYGNKPGDVVERLYKDGRLAEGLINNKVYREGFEVPKEAVQASANVNYREFAGELATLGLRTPVGTGGSEFVRDAAAEKKVVEKIRANIKAGLPWSENIASAGMGGPRATNERIAAATDEEIIAFLGGANKFGVIASGYGINALYDPYGARSLERLLGGEGYGTGIYGGTGPGQYDRGSKAITESDILALGKAVGNAAKDPQAAANASKQLISIFENDSSWLRREQARDALSYGLPGYAGGPEETTASARFATGGAGGAGATMGPNGVMTYTASDGRQFTSPEAYTSYQENLDTKKSERQSAYDQLYQEFDQYGLASLVTPLKGLIEDGLDVRSSSFRLKLRESEEYKKRFAANAQRLQKGLRALSEAEYIGLEDQYQDVMRRYGLPESYYTKGDVGRQEGFEKFISGDVSPVELEDRVQTAQRRVLNAPKEIKDALTQFYGAEVGNGDILAYVLDPGKAIENIKRKVTAAEIGGGALRAGLNVSRTRAEELEMAGVTKEAAQQGFGTIASGLERGRQLSEIYQQPDYTQAVAEAEVFALPNAEQARRQRRKIGQLETAAFGGTTGMTGGALGRERAGQY
jgi:hypothetical protein